MNNYIFPFLWMRGEEESILRREMEKIDQCGIGAVCVEARPHDDFCGPGWWHDMDIVLEEAKARGMKVWILDDKHFPTGYANGLIEQKYPERKKQYIACTTADVFGASRPLTLNVGRMLKPDIGFWEIGAPVDYAERARNTLVAVVALRFDEGLVFHEGGIDLTDQCKDGMCTFQLPEGQWRIHTIYRTRTDGGNDTYINMIDAVSAHTQIEGVYEAHYARYGAEFGKTIAGFFSDEPQFGNISEQCFDTRLGKPKMPLPWSGELEEMLKERYGESYRALLPLLFVDTAEKQAQPQMRYDYMDCISKLYAKNFCNPIGAWCKEHHVEYIGHVVEDNGVHSRLGLGAAHWFRAMEGQDMAGIDVIGGQYVFGAPAQIRKNMGLDTGDGEFFHYALGKMGASAGHLDPKKQGRTMCELFGAYGWSFGVRNMKYLLDHLLARGVNHLVPHAFSMAEYPDHDCPPHFYARGNNPEFPWFARLMKYANRMCDQLNGGQHVASVAVLYDGELDWCGERMPMQKVCRALTEHQIEFDIVPMDMLRNLSAYNGRVADGKLTINGVTFGALLVPQAEYLPQGLADFAASAPDFPVLVMDALPKAFLRDEGSYAPAAVAGCGLTVVPLAALAEKLGALGLRTIELQPAFGQITVYHYNKEGNRYLLVNESPEQTWSGRITLPANRPLVCYDGMEDQYTALNASCGGGRAVVELTLTPGACVLLTEGAEATAALPGAKDMVMDLSKGWQVKCVRARERDEDCPWQEMETLAPVSDAAPSFSGRMLYRKEVELAAAPKAAVLRMEQVYEVVTVRVNGKEAGFRLTPPYEVELTGLQQGRNVIEVEVASTPARDQLNFPMPPFDFLHEALEPAGMFGAVELLLRK